MEDIEFKQYLRCPFCNGKIAIPKAETSRLPYFVQSPERIPFCIKCGRRFKVSIKYEELIEVKLKEI